MFSGVKGIINRGEKIKGTVVLMHKNVLDINSITSVRGVIGQGFDIIGSTLDNLTAFLGRSVSLQLISATKADGLFFLSFAYFLHPQPRNVFIISHACMCHDQLRPTCMEFNVKCMFFACVCACGPRKEEMVEYGIKVLFT